MRHVRKIVIELGIMTAIGLLLAALAPYGTYRLGMAERIAYWVPAALLGYLAYRPTIEAALWAGRRLEFPEAVTLAVAAMIAAVPLTFWLLWMEGRRWPIEADELLGRYLGVALIGGAVTVVMTLRSAPDSADPSPPDVTDRNDPVVVAPRLHDRLAPGFSFPVRALQMEDHYVRVHGAAGSELLLMRMGDAIAELDGVEGEQVHRSWWVARDAVEGVRQDARRTFLQLGNELEAPVARSRAADLRKAGWL